MKSRGQLASADKSKSLHSYDASLGHMSSINAFFEQTIVPRTTRVSQGASTRGAGLVFHCRNQSFALPQGNVSILRPRREEGQIVYVNSETHSHCSALFAKPASAMPSPRRRAVIHLPVAKRSAEGSGQGEPESESSLGDV